LKKKNGWFIHNGLVVSQKFVEINNLYKEAAARKGIELELVGNNEVHGLIENNQICIKPRAGLKEPDFVVFMDKDIRLAKHMERLGYRLFNSAYTIESCDDKIATYQILANNGVRIPKTLIAPKVFNNGKETDESFVDFIEKEFDYPLVIKEAFGSFGAQVYLIKNREELKSKRNEILSIPHLYQEFIKPSSGRDVRIHVVGDKVVTAMLRTSESDFRANITNGGKASRFEPPKAFEELAIKASKLVDADFTGIDLLFGEDEEPIICEINSNAHIKNIMDCTGVNVADHIFDYILETLDNE
jgi:RimK family alpha-L-glutamate ligase